MSITQQIGIKPIVGSPSLGDRAYEALKAAITDLDIYGHAGEVRLDERRLSQVLGVSRTPVREALTVLEQEGFVRFEARRGVFVNKKTKREIVDMIHACAALESMAARLACARATDAQLRSLREAFPEFYDECPSYDLAVYSNANVRFRRAVISLGQCSVISGLTNNLLMHLRSIHKIALRYGERVQKWVAEHIMIIEALEARDAELVAQLIRDHAFSLAEHIGKYGSNLKPTTS